MGDKPTYHATSSISHADFNWDFLCATHTERAGAAQSQVMARVPERGSSVSVTVYLQQW